MDDYKIIIYRGYFQYRLVSLLTYVFKKEQQLFYTTCIIILLLLLYSAVIPADNLPVKVFALDALTKVVHWSPCGY